MATYNPELQSIRDRLEKLERQNRWFKRAAFAVLLVAAAIVAMGQAQTKRVVEANEFVLKDSAGRVRARLSMEVEAGNKPALTFFASNGLSPASLAGGDEPFLVLNRAGRNQQVSLIASKDLYGLGLYDKAIRAGLSVQKGAPGLDLFDENGKRRVGLTDDSSGPSLKLEDERGFSAILGSTDLLIPRTGRKEATSAASLVLFGKEGKVIWSAPQ